MTPLKRNDADCKKDEDMDVHNLQDVMMDLKDLNSEIQEKFGSSNNFPDDLDEDDSMG
ncbi:unnamed protein product, partial [Eruca vesicaria subsp. sativa]|nr:unnamed protein product [Eruca vesicaria subsp. sativa]